MKAMPGNKFLDEMERSGVFGSAEVFATLALAYEQRTANLIAYAQVADFDIADLLGADVIAPRLGLGDER